MDAPDPRQKLWPCPTCGAFIYEPSGCSRDKPTCSRCAAFAAPSRSAPGDMDAAGTGRLLNLCVGCLCGVVFVLLAAQVVLVELLALACAFLSELLGD